MDYATLGAEIYNLFQELINDQRFYKEAMPCKNYGELSPVVTLHLRRFTNEWIERTNYVALVDSIKNKPEKLLKKIKELNKEIKALMAFVDKRK